MHNWKRKKKKSHKAREIRTKERAKLDVGKPKIKKPHWCIKVLEPYGIKSSSFHPTRMDWSKQLAKC